MPLTINFHYKKKKRDTTVGVRDVNTKESLCIKELHSLIRERDKTTIIQVDEWLDGSE